MRLSRTERVRARPRLFQARLLEDLSRKMEREGRVERHDHQLGRLLRVPCACHPAVEKPLGGRVHVPLARPL